MTDLAYDMLPMVPFADKASIAWNNKQYSRWVGNMLFGDHRRSSFHHFNGDFIRIPYCIITF